MKQLYVVTREDLKSFGYDVNTEVKPQWLTITSTTSIPDDLVINVGMCQLENTIYINADVDTYFGLKVNDEELWFLATKDNGLTLQSTPKELSLSTRHVSIQLLPVIDVYFEENFKGMSITDRYNLLDKWLENNEGSLLRGRVDRPDVEKYFGIDKILMYREFWKDKYDYNVVSISYEDRKATILGFDLDIDLTQYNLCTASLVDNHGNKFISGQHMGFYLEPKIFHPTEIKPLDRSVCEFNQDGLIINTEAGKIVYTENKENLAVLGVPNEPGENDLYVWENTYIPRIGLVDDKGVFKIYIMR